MLKVLEKWFAWLTEGVARAVATGIITGVHRGIEAVGCGEEAIGADRAAEKLPAAAAAGSNNGAPKRPRRAKATARS